MRTFAVLLCTVGCYNPTIPDGSIFCSTDNKCPSGFQCSLADSLCYKNPPTPPSPYGDGKLGSPTLDSDGILTLDTDSGSIVQSNPMTGATKEIVPASSQTFGVGQTSGPGVAIWSFTSLTIPAGVTVQVSANSRNIPVLAATTSLTIDGVIDLDGTGGTNGQPANRGDNPYGIAEGGGGGAMAGTAGGGGGGGHAAAGTMGMATGAGAAGVAYGTNDPPVYFGAGGGGGSGAGGTPGVGGLGGGAITLLSPMVAINGKITTNGNDGHSAFGGDAGGGGGGAGGTILVSGNSITLGAMANLSAVGGAGGAGSGAGGSGGKGAVGVIRLLGAVTTGGTASPSASSSAAALTEFPK